MRLLLFRRRVHALLRSCVPLWVCLCPCAMVELFSFWAASMFWPIPQRISDRDSSIVVLVVSDPQLIGHINEPKWVGLLSRWDADRYLQRGYASASRAVRPDLEVFLGDLFDEGVFLEDEQQFVRARDRFLRIFPLDKRSGVNRVYLPGDNDIGGEMEPVYARLGALFIQHFPPHFHNNNNNNSDNNNNKLKQFNNNKLKQFLSIYETNLLENGAIRCIYCGDGGGPAAATGPSSRPTNTVRLLLSHFPVLPYLTPKMEQQLRSINVVLSAHDHTTGVYMQWRRRRTAAAGGMPGHMAAGAVAASADVVQWRWTVSMVEPSTLPLVEFKSPTVSYRMGVPKMGYGLLVVTPYIANGTASVHFSVLWLPSRFLQLGMFLGLTVLGLLWTALSLSVCCRRCETALSRQIKLGRRTTTHGGPGHRWSDDGHNK